MKKENLVSKAILTAALVGLIFTGCKKNDDTPANPTDASNEQTINAADDSRFTAASDEILDETNGIALNNSKFRGDFVGIITGTHYPCNGTIDSSMQSQGTIKVNYHGNNCSNTFSLRGAVTLQLPYNTTTNTVTPFSAAGSVLSITFHDLSVTRLSDNKPLIFNGTKYVTNVNGGLVDDAADFANAVLFHITGMLQITFDDNTVRTWNIDRNRLFTRNASITLITVTGNATQNGYSNASAWGINRMGNDFTITINTPIVFSSACSYNAMGGVKMHHGVVRELTVTYGVDQNGNTGLGTASCPYGYKLNWVDAKGEPHQVVVPY